MFASILGPYPRPVDTGAESADGVEAILRDQVEAGLGMVSDGRVHHLASGAEARHADARHAEAIVEAWQLADDLCHRLVGEIQPSVTAPLVKVCLVGPYSGGLASGLLAGHAAAKRRRRTLNMAEMLRGVAASLFDAGASVVQFEEDRLIGIAPLDHTERSLAAEALDTVSDGLAGHLALSVAGGNADGAGARLFFDRPFASYLFDVITGPENWRLIAEAPSDRGIVCGVADARTEGPDSEAVMIWAARYAASTNARGLERVGLAPSAGLERLPREAAQRKLNGLAEAARKAGLPPGELLRDIDPRSIDARSAALGSFDPKVGPAPLPGRASRSSSAGARP